MTSKAKRTGMKQSSSRNDGEDNSLETERNFLLLSNKCVMPASDHVKDGEDVSPGASQNEEHAEHDGTVKDERYPESSDDSSRSDDDYDDNKREQTSEDNGASAKLHTNDELQGELSTMSFEEIIRLQNKVGTKEYSKIAYGAAKRKQTAEPVKQLNKHRPNEISAKKTVPFLRKVVPVKKITLRDPRFDDLSGEFRPEVFRQTYKFIDEIRQREGQIVKKKLEKVKSDAKREKLKSLLKRMENQERARQIQAQQREKELEFKRKQRELVGQGHKPFYLKRSEKKKLELAEKFNELKKSGKLENFLSKKRKRNAIKDRRKLPYQHKKN